MLTGDSSINGAPTFSAGASVRPAALNLSLYSASYISLNISLNELDKKMYIKSRTEGGSVKTIKIGNISMSGINMRKIFNFLIYGTT